MSIERHRYASATANHVTKRLCCTVVVFVGAICLCGGYILGNIARLEARRSTDLIAHNLTAAAELLYKRSKRLSPKAVNYHNPEVISAKLLEMFHCDCSDCGKMKNNNIVEFAKTLVGYEVAKLIRSIHNATAYVDTLR